MEPALFSNAERAEDQIQNVVGGCGSRNLIEWPQGVVEIEQEHFVGDFVLDGYPGCGQRSERFSNPFLMAQVGEESSFGLGAGFSTDVTQNFISQLGNSFPGCCGSLHSYRSILDI